MNVNASFIEKRTSQRFSFFADAEIILHDGTLIRSQLAELSAHGCYMGTLVPIPIGTEFRLRIAHAMTTCELNGKVVYVHSGSGLGIFGIGVFIKKISAEERRVVDAWLFDLNRKRLAMPSRFDGLASA